MGKRKSSRKVAKKEQPKLDTTFPCLSCSHEKSISVTMDRKIRVGSLKCKVCSATYQAALNALSDPIDVYSEWIDACDEAKRQEIINMRASTATAGPAAPAASGRRRQDSNTANSTTHRSGKDTAVGRFNDDDDDDGFYDDAGRGRQREAVRAPAQLTDESDIDDF